MNTLRKKCIERWVRRLNFTATLTFTYHEAINENGFENGFTSISFQEQKALLLKFFVKIFTFQKNKI